MSINVIEIRDVAKYFGETRAVDGVDLTVQAGELFGLIGHNGAGKTTLFKMLLGLLEPTRGELRIAGELAHGAAFRQVRRSVGYLPESLALYDNLSGLETLRFFAKLKGADLASCAPLLHKLGLGYALHRRVRGYSKGMRQRLGFAQALLGKPRLLFLDEPTNGLDPQAIREFYEILHELREQGVTVILSSHILAEIQLRVDRLALMQMGKIRALGTVHELRESLDLPVDLQITAQESAKEALQNTVEKFPNTHLQQIGEIVHIRCPRQTKMELLKALMLLDHLIMDLQVREPSLEDVFLGYSDTAPC